MITLERLEDALPLGQALVAGGITTLEITLRTEHAFGAITALRKALPEAWVGVGTVATLEQYRAAEAAGAQFVITPGSTLELLEYGIQAQAPLIPGISSLSELMEGYRLGYRAFKFFRPKWLAACPRSKPLQALFRMSGLSRLGAFRPIWPQPIWRFLTFRPWGSWLTPADLIRAGDWAGITRIAQESLEMLKNK